MTLRIKDTLLCQTIHCLTPALAEFRLIGVWNKTTKLRAHLLLTVGKVGLSCLSLHLLHTTRL